MRTLIIGGTGFISCAAARAFVVASHSVAVFHRGERTSNLTDVETIHGDRRSIHDRATKLRAFRPDVVIDCVAFRGSDVESAVEVFRGVAQRIVVLSSVDVYRAFDRLNRREGGAPHHGLLHEDSELRQLRYPRRAFATSQEDVLWDYDKLPVECAALGQRDLPATILRLPAVYGPGDHKRKRVASVLESLASPVVELDAALARWRWTRLFVDDAASAILAASDDPKACGRTYNVGDEVAWSEGDWVREIARVAGYHGKIIEKNRGDLPREIASELDAQDFDHDIVIDTSRIRDELGWRSRTSLDEALRKTIEWDQTGIASDLKSV